MFINKGRGIIELNIWKIKLKSFYFYDSGFVYNLEVIN